MRACRDGGSLKLLLAKLSWRKEVVALDQPSRVVGFPEREQRLPQLLDGLEGPHQSRFSFNVRMKRSAQPLPSGARMKAGELSMPRKANSFWK